MVLSDKAQAVNSNHVSICSGLAAIFNGKFSAISGRISEMMKDRAKVAIDH